MLLDFTPEKDYKPYPIEKAWKLWQDDNLNPTKVKHTSVVLQEKGYCLSPDDLNKLRQLVSKLSKHYTRKAIAIKALKELCDIVIQLNEEYPNLVVDDTVANQINHLTSQNAKVSKTCLGKLVKLYVLEKVFYDDQ